MGEHGNIDNRHPLAAMWSNVCLMLDARCSNDAEEMAYDLVLMDYAAKRIDEFSKTNMIGGDESACAVLHQWRTRLWLVPVPALSWNKRMSEHKKGQS